MVTPSSVEGGFRPGPPEPKESPRCPSCHQPLPRPTADAGPLTARWPHFPFCSDRCRLVDLGRWLTGAYVIPGPEVPPADPEG